MNSVAGKFSLLRKPSAWIPLVMSLAALVMVAGYAVFFGVAYHEDEGTAARIFQLLMVLEFPVAGYFAIRWLPKYPWQAVKVLMLQAVAWVIPVIAVMWLESMVG